MARNDKFRAASLSLALCAAAWGAAAFLPKPPQAPTGAQASAGAQSSAEAEKPPEGMQPLDLRFLPGGDARFSRYGRPSGCPAYLQVLDRGDQALTLWPHGMQVCLGRPIFGARQSEPKELLKVESSFDGCARELWGLRDGRAALLETGPAQDFLLPAEKGFYAVNFRTDEDVCGFIVQVTQDWAEPGPLPRYFYGGDLEGLQIELYATEACVQAWDFDPAVLDVLDKLDLAPGTGEPLGVSPFSLRLEKNGVTDFIQVQEREILINGRSYTPQNWDALAELYNVPLLGEALQARFYPFKEEMPFELDDVAEYYTYRFYGGGGSYEILRICDQRRIAAIMERMAALKARREIVLPYKSYVDQCFFGIASTSVFEYGYVLKDGTKWQFVEPIHRLTRNDGETVNVYVRSDASAADNAFCPPQQDTQMLETLPLLFLDGNTGGHKPWAYFCETEAWQLTGVYGGELLVEPSGNGDRWIGFSFADKAGKPVTPQRVRVFTRGEMDYRWEAAPFRPQITGELEVRNGSFLLPEQAVPLLLRAELPGVTVEYLLRIGEAE